MNLNTDSGHESHCGDIGQKVLISENKRSVSCRITHCLAGIEVAIVNYLSSGFESISPH